MPLPTRDKPVAATRQGPKILILYSLPKVGKTSELVKLAEVADALILDTEDGTASYTTTKVTISKYENVVETVNEIFMEGGRRKSAGKSGMEMFPYKFLALDTLDKFEEYCEKYATEEYRDSKMNSNKKFEENGYKSVTDLPNGAGYLFLREAVMDGIDLLAKATPHLILIVHVREKLMLDKTNQEVKVNDLSLTGKLSAMVCAKADAIGYMYRNAKGELRVSFKTHDGAIMGARQPYLAGKDIEFSWSAIYPDIFPQPENAAQ